MSNKKPSMDPETVLVTLDQINQTIEVLSSVVGRLQRYVQTHMPQQPQNELPFPTQHGSRVSKKSLH
jgi:hypothetical protein